MLFIVKKVNWFWRSLNQSSSRYLVLELLSWQERSHVCICVATQFRWGPERPLPGNWELVTAGQHPGGSMA